MPITAAELVKFGSLNNPEDDVATTGGNIATAIRLDEFVQAANDTLDVLSDGADTRDVELTGRDAGGAIVVETLTLNGTTPVTGSQTFERLLKVILKVAGTPTSDASRTVTVRRATGAATVVDVPVDIHTERRLFYDSSSDPSVIKIRFEKEHWKNIDPALTLTNATLTLTADPVSRYRVGLENADGDTATNRLTAPASVTFVDDSVAIVVSDITAGSDVGLWAEQNLPAADAPHKSTYSTKLAGSTA